MHPLSTIHPSSIIYPSIHPSTHPFIIMEDRNPKFQHPKTWHVFDHRRCKTETKEEEKEEGKGRHVVVN
jgi:hypothetical protein